MTDETVGGALRRWRKQRRLSLRALGDLVNYSHVYLWEIEKDHKRPLPEIVAACDDRLGAGGQLISMANRCQDVREADLAGPDTGIEGMNRREFMRVLSFVGTLAAAPPLGESVDVERLGSLASRGQIDPATVEAFATMNAQLWRVFASSSLKGAAFRLVRAQLDVLMESFRSPHKQAIHLSLCALLGDLLQLAGEIFFDQNRYTDAAHCYELAASASKEAKAYDLWACALTRHAFIGIYERKFGRAASMLELAGQVAGSGDPQLSTAHWVQVVEAQALAGLGRLSSCQRSLALAEKVTLQTGPVHNGGWLRFDGSRLSEENGSCYAELARPDLAEPHLLEALRQPNRSVRRTGTVLTDLALIGSQKREPDQLVHYGGQALAVAQQTGSGVLAQKLSGLQAHLKPLQGIGAVRQLQTEIAALTRRPLTEFEE